MSGTWNYTLDDTSPVIKYEPYSDGNLTGGWQTWYSGSGFNKQYGEASSGDSFHLSSFSGASLSLSFFGTGISLIGTANCSYQVTVDGSLKPNGSPPFDTLFSENDLESGIHNITLTVTEVSTGGMVQVDKAILFSPVSNQQSVPQMERIDNQNTSVISYTSDAWQTQNDPQIPSRQDPSAYQQTNVFEASAWLNFTGRAIEVRGESNYGWWTYEVMLDGQRYTNFNASNSWIVPDAVLFYQDGLDESALHMLNITNTGSGGMDFALNSVTAFHFGVNTTASNGTTSAPSGPDSSSQKTGVSGGVIAGAVVASLVGTAILLGLLYFFLNRRKETTFSDVTPYQSDIPHSTGSSGNYMKEAKAGGALNSNENPVSDTSRDHNTRSPGFPIRSPGARTDSLTNTPTFILPTTTPSSLSQNLASPPHSPDPTGPQFRRKDRRTSTPPPRDQVQEQSAVQSQNPTPTSRLPDATDDSAVDRIASVVAERIAQRFGGLSGEDLLSPPPEYDTHL